MKELLKALAQSGTFRRFLVFVLTTLAALFQKRLGFEIPEGTIDMIVALAMVYIGGGNLKEAIVERAKAKQAEAQKQPPAPLSEALEELRKPLL